MVAAVTEIDTVHHIHVTYIRHGELLIQSDLNFVYHSNTEGQHSHKHSHL